MSDGTKNLMVARGDRSVWDKPGFGSVLSSYDREPLITAGWATTLAMVGVRRGGFLGGILTLGGLVLTVRAAMGRHDFSCARDYLDQALQDRGWRRADIVAESSDESFPASDSPSWTSGTGARIKK